MAVPTLTGALSVVWMLVYPQSSHVEILMPDVMVLGGGAFGSHWGHEGGAFMSGISALVRDSTKLPRPFRHVRTQ